MAGLLMVQAAASSSGGAAVQADRCAAMSFESSRFTVCVARPSVDKIAIVTTGRDGKPVRSFSRLAQSLRRSPIAFAINGGMFGVDGRPIGLSVVDGVQQAPLNLRAGTGNFYMVPNGIFYGDANGWHVTTTADFAGQQHQALDFATQSGPILLTAGKMNPNFADDGPSRKIRNGVGIERNGSAVFVISETPVSFGRFARLFRDRLDCRDALYLDGFVSSLWDPASGRRDDHAALGPLIVATPRSDGSPQH